MPRVITTNADDRKRVVVPQAKPGQVYDAQANGDGSMTLTPLKPARRAPRFLKLEKRGKYTVGVLDGPIDPDALNSPLKNYGYCCFAQNGPPTRRDEGKYPS
jgi:hypothetical protein